MTNQEEKEPFLTIGNHALSSREETKEDPNNKNTAYDSTTNITTPIYFQEDWDTGIGGGLWSTGLAFCQYLTTDHALGQLRSVASAAAKRDQQKEAGISVLELGSGNGLLSVCLLALAHHEQQLQQLDNKNNSNNTQPTPLIQELVITDLLDHIPLIQKTLDANPHFVRPLDKPQPTQPRVHVTEHCWGKFRPPQIALPDDQKWTLSDRVNHGTAKFDLIIGSDVAYHEDLYDILIESLWQFSNDTTLVLMGVTMADTKPAFFHQLREAGFVYEKFADHLLSPDFRGRTFGIFQLRRKERS